MSRPAIVIQSRERSAIGTTWQWAPANAIIALHRDEAPVYRAAGIENELWEHGLDFLVDIRNWILEKVGAGNEVVLLDDDITKVGRFAVGKAVGKYRLEQMDGQSWIDSLEEGFATARQYRYHLFGVSPTTNPLMFNPERAWNVNTFVNGPCMCVIVTDVRFDRELRVKNDYGFTAEHVRRGLGTFRLNYLWQMNDFDKLPGGRSVYKKPSDAAASAEYLLAKYPDMFRRHPRRAGQVIMSVKS